MRDPVRLVLTCDRGLLADMFTMGLAIDVLVVDLNVDGVPPREKSGRRNGVVRLHRLAVGDVPPDLASVEDLFEREIAQLAGRRLAVD